MLQRYLKKQVQADLKKKMVFVGGARQVGKTTLSKSILGKASAKGYLNWDIPADRERILKQTLPNQSIWAFDEIHKYRNWRNYLKGLHDAKTGRRILVTGSARLDFYRYSGDSLQGRYHYLRLHPLSVAELGIKNKNDFDTLFELGGFPEPFLGQSKKEAKRWSREYRNRILREELNELERVSDLGQMELLMLRLPDLVGSPLSINAIREDLQLTHKTLSRWVDILERVYGIFRITPFGAPTIRAVKKERKHYHFDWTVVDDPGLRFENLVALHLLKWIHFQQDTQGIDLDLHFFRDVDGREVDFVITEKRKPTILIECKSKTKSVSKGLKYLSQRFPKANAWQISMDETTDSITPEKIRRCHAIHFLQSLI